MNTKPPSKKFVHPDSTTKHPIYQFQFHRPKSKAHTVAPADALAIALLKESQVRDPTATLPSEDSESDPATRTTAKSLDNSSEAACRSTLRHIARSHGLELSIPTIKIASEPLQSFPFLPVSPFDPDRHRDFYIAHERESSNSSPVDR